MTGLPTLSGAAQSTSSDASRDKGAHDAPTFPRLNVLNAITTMLAPVANTAPARVGSVPERVADPAGRRPAGELADAATAGNAPVPPGSQPHEPSVLTRDHEAAVMVAATPLSVTGEWQVAAGSGEFCCGDFIERRQEPCVNIVRAAPRDNHAGSGRVPERGSWPGESGATLVLTEEGETEGLSNVDDRRNTHHTINHLDGRATLSLVIH